MKSKLTLALFIQPHVHAPRRVIDKVKGVRNSVTKLGGATPHLMDVQHLSTGLQNHYTDYNFNLAGVASPNLVTDFHPPP